MNGRPRLTLEVVRGDPLSGTKYAARGLLLSPRARSRVPWAYRSLSPLPTPAARSGAVADLDWLRGRTIVHQIVIGTSDPAASLAALLAALARTSGNIRALTVKPTAAGQFEAVLQATALSAEEARGLVSRIAALPSVNSAAIEHMLIS
jgi:hypothetical protein